MRMRLAIRICVSLFGFFITTFQCLMLVGIGLVGPLHNPSIADRLLPYMAGSALYGIVAGGLLRKDDKPFIVLGALGAFPAFTASLLLLGFLENHSQSSLLWLGLDVLVFLVPAGSYCLPILLWASMISRRSKLMPSVGCV